MKELDPARNLLKEHEPVKLVHQLLQKISRLEMEVEGWKGEVDRQKTKREIFLHNIEMMFEKRAEED